MWEILAYKIDSADKHLMLALNYDGGYMQDCFWLFMSSRVLWILPSLLFIIYAFRCFNFAKAMCMIMAMIATVAMCDQISANIIKPFFARLRPSHAQELEGLLHFVDGYRGGLYGFVSSHAANSWGAVTLAMLIIRRRRAAHFLIALALCVSYSRIYLGVHYPSDVICGGMLGSLIGFCIYRAMHCVLNMAERTKIRIAFALCALVVSTASLTENPQSGFGFPQASYVNLTLLGKNIGFH